MYSARITRLAPTAFIFLIDRSGSMEEKMMFGQSLMTKAEAVAFVTNTLIRELINRCRREEGIVDYFDIAAIGYSGDQAEMLLGTREAFTKPSALAVMPCDKRVFSRERVLPDGSTVITSEEVRYWIEPKSGGSTPMRAALEQAYALAGKWCRKQSNRYSYPPTIFNITDGEASDGDSDLLCDIAEEIKALGTEDGNVLLININISAKTCSGTILFPGSKEELPMCRYVDTLYDMSSEMPEEYNGSIMKLRPGARPPFRAMSINTSAADLIAMMDIGSRSMTRIL